MTAKAAIDYSRYECLKIEKEGKLAIVTLNQPDTGNRIAHQFHVELQDIWADLARDKEVNAILLQGSGKYFSVGGNVKCFGAFKHFGVQILIHFNTIGFNQFTRVNGIA